MKKLFISIIVILLLVSIGFNIKLNKELNSMKAIVPISNQVINAMAFGEIMVNKVVMSPENNATITIAKYAPNTAGNWHVHPQGQTIYVSDGEGYYQEEKGKVRKIKAGDTIKTKASVKSWHGSTKDKELTLISISPLENNALEIMEPIEIEEYENIKI